MAENAEPGTIVTFYSYKGGTGRSMALANCAYLAARNLQGKGRVLAIDWDLEAPGLHRYFPDSEQGDNAERPGLIDYFTRLAELLDADTYQKLSGTGGGEVLAELLPLDDYLVRDAAEGLDLIKAGMFSPEYSHRIATFDWAEFFRRYPRVYRAFRSYLTGRYRWCFIDSRTGLSDVSGVSTMIMPEKLVATFTPNRQSLDGAIELCGRAVEFRRTSDDPRPLAVFPLPSRIVTEEHKLLQAAQERYRTRFEEYFRLCYGLDKCDLRAYFQEVALPHKGFYGFHELVALRDEPGATDALSINRAYERFFRRLTVLDSAWDQMPGSRAPEPATRQAAPGATGTAFSKGFENDVFISYSHVDDAAFGGQDGFVSRLQRDLTIRLAQVLGKPVRIWRDPRLSGDDVFKDTVAAAIENSAILLPVLSPAYVNSEWCRREMDMALRAINTGDKSQRVFPVFRSPVDRDRLPEQLPRVVGYEFFRIDPGGRARDLGVEADAGAEREYWMRVDDLAYDLARVLERIGKEPGPGTAPRRTVYLAETTSDLTSYRDHLRRELVARGYRVVPESPLPLSAEELLPMVESYVATADLSVHLVGSRSGLVPEGEMRSISEIQLDAATRAGVRRVVWVPRDAGPAANWVQERSHTGQIDTVQAGFEEFRAVTLDALEKGSRATEAAADLPQVYLLCEERDLDFAKQVRDWMSGQGFESILPLREGTPAEIRRDRLETIESAQGTAILWLSGTEAWLRVMLRDLREARVAARPRTKPCLVYIPEESTPAQKEFESREVEVLRNAPLARLAGFLERVREAPK